MTLPFRIRIITLPKSFRNVPAAPPLRQQIPTSTTPPASKAAPPSQTALVRHRTTMSNPSNNPASYPSWTRLPRLHVAHTRPPAVRCQIFIDCSRCYVTGEGTWDAGVAMTTAFVLPPMSQSGSHVVPTRLVMDQLGSWLEMKMKNIRWVDQTRPDAPRLNKVT